MRCVKAVLLMLLFATLLGCPKPEPDCSKCPKPDCPDGKALAPGSGEVWIEARGLVSFIFKNGGKSVQSVFLSPSGAEHPPLVAVNTVFLADANASRPDWVASGPGDTGLAVWRFTENSIDTSNVEGTALTYNDEAVNPADPESNLASILWVPSMKDIFGVKQDVEPTAVTNAAARGSWTVGALTPIFDQERHKKEKWDIGQRKATQVADGFRLKLTLADPGLPLKLKLTRDGTPEEVMVKGGGTILFTAYPRTVPKRNEDMKHFHHFYSLLKISPTDKNEPTIPLPPTPAPARCAPSIFYPPVE
jgi:hypothetical protein